MATNWKSQQGDGMYSLQFETDDIEKYKLVEKASRMAIDDTPTADVVSMKAFEQVKWERDTAIEQLESYGVGFCENKELAEVKHAFRTLNVGHRSYCSNCGGLAVCEKYCSLCGAKMDGGKKK